MADLCLPPGPGELLQTVRVPLARAFGGEQHLRLGGGTALAARWGHRHSTDIDLFVEPEPYRNFHWNTGGPFTLALTAAATVDRLVIDADATYISFQGRPGHVSISPARALPVDPRSSDTVRGTALPLETTAEILAKKLRFRMAHDKELLSRDLYDLALARERAPAALQDAFDAIRTDQLAEIAAVFEDHRARADHPAASPVLAPSDPALAARAADVVEHFVGAQLVRRTRDRGRDPGITR